MSKTVGTTLNKCPLGKRLRQARRAKGLTQKGLGEKAGIDAASASSRINQYEMEKHVPDYATARLLAKALAVPTAFFYAENDQLAELIKIMGALTADEKLSLLSRLKRADAE